MPRSTLKQAGAEEVDLLRQTRHRTRWLDFPGVLQLPQLLLRAAEHDLLRRWRTPAGTLKAFALIDALGTLRWDCLPAAYADGTMDELIGWAFAHSHVASQPYLFAASHSDDLRRLRFLHQQGFLPHGGPLLHLERGLAEAPIAPQLPPGWQVRSVEAADVPALVALHQQAFGTPHLDLAQRHAVMRMPTYDAALDLLITAPDGTLAAYAMANIDPAEQLALDEPVAAADLYATAPQFRGRGLARYLLLELSRRLYARGCSRATMLVSSDNHAMQRAALACDCVVTGETYRFAYDLEHAAPQF